MSRFVSYPRLAGFILATLFTCSASVFSPLQAQESDSRWFPDIPGYQTLAGDFHMHTVFSDGHVWPTMRVQEADRDGLEVISITEHTDYEGYADDIKRDRERGYQIALKEAKKRGILLIRGAEISPRVAPYHNNVLFATDLNAFSYDYMKETQGTFVMKEDIKKEELMAPFLEAQKQGAFVFYNHPSYSWWVPSENHDLFTPIHQELLKMGILGGVEVVNGGRYNIIAHRMAEKYNLTLFGNSDAHWGIDANSDRPITLVFATDKTEKGVREAIVNRRTAVYSNAFLIGRKPEVEALFKASLDIRVKKVKAKNRPRLEISIHNISAMDFHVNITSDYILDQLPLGMTVLKAHETTTLLLDAVWAYPESVVLGVHVQNIAVSPDACLKTELTIPLSS